MEEKMSEIKINDRISYIPSCEKPLSSEVGIVRGDRFTYIYDTGSIPETLHFLQSLQGRCDIVISHFHGDHTWWLTDHKRGDEGVEENDSISLTYEKPKFRRLFIGAYTKKYLPEGKVISAPTMISSYSGVLFSSEERVLIGQKSPTEESSQNRDNMAVESSDHQESTAKESLSYKESTAKESLSHQENTTVESSYHKKNTEERTLGYKESETKENIYCTEIPGNNREAYTNVKPVEIYDGVKIDIYPIPNSHCKGALLMMVDDEYAFIGDSSYCMEKDGRPMYNSQLLKAEIDLLESIPADKLLVSHDRKFVRNKAVVLRQLKTIYSHRTTDSPYIYVK